MIRCYVEYCTCLVEIDIKCKRKNLGFILTEHYMPEYDQMFPVIGLNSVCKQATKYSSCNLYWPNHKYWCHTP